MRKSTLLVLSGLLTLFLLLAPLSVHATSGNDDHHSKENEKHDRDHHERHDEDCRDNKKHHDDKDHHGDDDKKHKNHKEDKNYHEDHDDDHSCNNPSPSPSPRPTATVTPAPTATPSPTPVICNGTNVWATRVVSATQGVKKDGTAISPDRSNPLSALGPNDQIFYSLGKNGTITVGFTNPIKNLIVTDFNIFEFTNGPLTYPQEDGTVEVSKDNVTWFTVPTVIHSNVNILGINPVDFSSTGLTTIKYVRITDQTNFALNTVDGVNGGNADGIDVDAVQGFEESCQ